MDVKLAAVFAKRAALAGAQGGPAPMPVTALCAQLGISRTTFYEAQHRFEADGVMGLLPQSRRPHHSPNQTPAEVEDRVIAMRKWLDEQGWDAGSKSIHKRLTDAGVACPSVPTIDRILRRRGMVSPQPQKRPRASWKRFAYSERNACWQIDAFVWRLADASKVAVFQLVDDCTRKDVGDFAAPSETGDAALACFLQAVNGEGPPEMLLMDNGVAFSGRRRGWESALEQAAAQLGVRTVTSTPYHPQTCGKNERAHQTCQRWLRRQPPAQTLTELQAQLDTYRELYNTTRPHQALGGKTPNEAAAEVPVAKPASHEPITRRVTTLKVSARGEVHTNRYAISVGRARKGQRVTLIREGNHVTVFHGRTLLRELELDTTRNYQRHDTA